MAIDLHIHSCYSDGSKTPNELVMLTNHLDAISITDHDSMDAYMNMDFNLLKSKLIPGIEMTVFAPYEIHILGYFKKMPNHTFGVTLKNINLKRMKDILWITQKMYEEKYISLSLQQMLRKYKVIRLEHIYDELEDKGISKQDFYFDHKLIHKKCVGISVEELIDFIHCYDGITSIAHPFRLKSDMNMEQKDIDVLILYLKEIGLDAIECYHESYSNDENEYYISYANKNRLFITGGSDYHGTSKPQVNLAVGRGNLCIPTNILEKIGF